MSENGYVKVGRILTRVEWQCLRCGCVVIDVTQHDRWHERNKRHG